MSINYNQAASEWNKLYNDFESIKNTYFEHTDPSNPNYNVNYNPSVLVPQLNQLQNELNNFQNALVNSPSGFANNFGSSLNMMMSDLASTIGDCTTNNDPSTDFFAVQTDTTYAQSALNQWAANPNG